MQIDSKKTQTNFEIAIGIIALCAVCGALIIAYPFYAVWSKIKA